MSYPFKEKEGFCLLQYHEILGSEKPMYAKKGLFKTFEEMDGTEEYQIIGFLEVLIGDEKRYEPLYERVGEVSCKQICSQ